MLRLEKRQDVFRAGSRPQRQEVVVGVCERAAAAHGDEAGIPDLRENHACSRVDLICLTWTASPANDSRTAAHYVNWTMTASLRNAS